MENATENMQRLALLIDADNVSAKYLPVILNEVPKYGIATYRRIYGDFTDPQAAKWRTQLLDNSIVPVQQFSNVKHHKDGEKAGKNATDSTLIIDAMDILYAGKVDGFIIVSSDSDFTRLAARLRESNMTVIGMGRNHTSISFRHACTKFVNVERLYELETGSQASESADAQSNADIEDNEEEVTIDAVSDVVGGIIRANDNKGRATTLAEVGNSLSNKFPDFDVRNFGYSQLSKLIEELDRFELVKTEGGYDVRIADAHASAEAVATFIVKTIGERKGSRIDLSSLSNLVHDAFPRFNFKDVGYSQFYKFVESVKGVKVTGKKHNQAELA